MAEFFIGDNIRDFFEDKARNGDAGFAVAFALRELSDAQKKRFRA
jgi:hypothetical protein